MPAELPTTPGDKPLLAVLKRERRDPVPMWMMRQAGRYLPEYRQLRQEKGSFLDLVYDSDAAAEQSQSDETESPLPSAGALPSR